jgi:hypothetical protein
VLAQSTGHAADDRIQECQTLRRKVALCINRDK